MGMAIGSEQAESAADFHDGEAEPNLRSDEGLATPPPTHVPGSRIAPAGHVASAANTTGTVLLDMRTGRRTELDHFGSRVWHILSSQPSMPSLVVSLRDEGMSAERLAEDVARLVARWQTHGMIEWR